MNSFSTTLWVKYMTPSDTRKSPEAAAPPLFIDMTISRLK
jgi:hypothetical protein